MSVASLDLNEVLLKQQEITGLLGTLQDTHERLLETSDSSNEDLDRIRKSIQICLNDLNTINGLLIDPRDGLVRKGIQKLEKREQRLRALDAEQDTVEAELKSWMQDGDVETGVDHGNPTLQISGNHQSLLQSYINSVGVENTTLANADSAKDDVSKDGCSKDRLLKNVKQLRLCKQYVTSEIEQLQALLDQLEKDRSVINDELRRNDELIQRQVNGILRNKDRIMSQREKILVKLGLLKNSEQRSSHSIFSLSSFTKQTDADLGIALSQCYEFIDAKKQSLKTIMHDNKAETSALKHSYETWKEVMSTVQSLESSLQSQFTKLDGHVKKGEIASMIRAAADTLNSIVDNNSNEKLILRAVLSELNALNQAEKELNYEVKPIPINKLPKAPELLKMGKSPPKVGLSTEFASNVQQPTGNFAAKSSKGD